MPWGTGEGSHAPAWAVLTGDRIRLRTSHHRVLITWRPPQDLFPWQCMASSLQDWLSPTSTQVGTCLQLCHGEAADGPSVLAHLQETKEGAQEWYCSTHTKKMPSPLNSSTAPSCGSLLARHLPREGDRTDAKDLSSCKWWCFRLALEKNRNSWVENYHQLH